MSDKDVLLEIQRSLGRIEGALEGLSDLPDRVRALEGWRKWLLGVQAALVAFVATAIRYLK